MIATLCHTARDRVLVDCNMRMRLAQAGPGVRVCTPTDRLANNDFDDWRALAQDELPPADAREWLVAGPLDTETFDALIHYRALTIPLARAPARLQAP